MALPIFRMSQDQTGHLGGSPPGSRKTRHRSSEPLLLGGRQIPRRVVLSVSRNDFAFQKIDCAAV
jgi:hypothetical protein